MSDSRRRDRRRVGDETRKRIDNLADGWKVPDRKARADDSFGPGEDSGVRSSSGMNAVVGEVAIEGDEHPVVSPGLGKTPAPRARKPVEASTPPRPNPILPTHTPRPEIIDDDDILDEEADELLGALQQSSPRPPPPPGRKSRPPSEFELDFLDDDEDADDADEDADALIAMLNQPAAVEPRRPPPSRHAPQRTPPPSRSAGRPSPKAARPAPPRPKPPPAASPRPKPPSAAPPRPKPPPAAPPDEPENLLIDTLKVPIGKPDPAPAPAPEPARSPAPSFKDEPTDTLPQPVIASSSSARNDDATELMTDLPPSLRDARGDETEFQAEVAMSSTVGLSSEQPSLPRKGGVFGDIKYVFTVFKGVTAARSERADVRERIHEEREGRSDKLRSIAREAAADASIRLPTIDDARAKLDALDDRRTRDQAAVASAESEIQSLTDTREREAAEYAEQLANLEQTLADTEAELAPLEKSASQQETKLKELGNALSALDEQIRKLEKRADGEDAAAVAAQLASVRAERQSVAREQPAINAKLGELRPEIETLTGQRDATRQAIEQNKQDDQQSKQRTEAGIAEQTEQKQQKQEAVVAADQERAEVLKAAGEKLAIERPEPLALKLRAVDHHDLVIATLQRRAMELEEMIRGVSKAAVFRGVVILLLIVAIPVLIALALI